MCEACQQALQVQASTTEVWNPEEQPITVAQLADAVRRAAKKDPTRVYQRPEGGGCKYTHDVVGGKVPGCIVGQGVFDQTGKVVDQPSLNSSVDAIIWVKALGACTSVDVWGGPIIDDSLSRYLVAWLRNVQGRQDGGETWGGAVAYADRNTSFARYAS